MRSAHFHKYGDVCCERCAPGFKALRRVDTGYRRGGATKETGAHRRNPLGGGGLWSISSSLVVDDVPTSPPSCSSTSPHKPPPQISPYLWKGALRYCPLLWLLLVWSLPEVSAQSPRLRTDSKWEVSVFFGRSALGDGTFVTPVEGGTTQVVGLSFDSSYVLGFRIAENLGPRLGAELEYAVANQPALFENLGPSLPQLELNQKVHTLAYNLVIYPREREDRIVPFVFIGIGTSLFDVSVASKQEALQQGVELADRWKFVFSYGGGVKLALATDWGVRFDIRDHVTGVNDFGLPSTAPLLGAGFRPEGSFHNWQMSVGYLYTFGVR